MSLQTPRRRAWMFLLCKGRRICSVLWPSVNTWEVLSLILKIQLNTIFKPARVPALDCFHKMALFSSDQHGHRCLLVAIVVGIEFIPFMVGKPRVFSEI